MIGKFIKITLESLIKDKSLLTRFVDHKLSILAMFSKGGLYLFFVHVRILLAQLVCQLSLEPLVDLLKLVTFSCKQHEQFKGFEIILLCPLILTGESHH